MARNARHFKILELIRDFSIEKQDDLASRLIDAGFDVTQATISRDIRELGLIKKTINGRQKYVKETVGEGRFSSNIANIYRNAVLTINSAQNLIVIKTIIGGASTVGINIDRMSDPRVLGCVAGDDTVLIVCATTKEATELVEILKEML